MKSGTIIGDSGGEAGDYRFLITAQPFDLGVDETKTVALGLVLANNIDDLRSSTETMRAVYAGEPVAIEPEDSGLPHSFSLEQNYPNPFNPVTTITYALPEVAAIELEVYDLLGHRVRILDAGVRPSGTYSVTFDANGLPSGLYFYRLNAGNFVKTRSLTVLK